MGQMSDYDIRPKLKVWTGSLNECRTFGRTSAKCYASMSVFYRWLVSALSSQEM